MRIQHQVAGALLVITAMVSHAEPIPVRVVAYEEGYTLIRGGKPYVVRGAGVVGNHVVASLAARGGNSLRTWGIEDAEATLDAAARHGLTVSMGLPVAAERLGFDYNDASLIKQQRQHVLNAVAKYKDHPALLAWIIGNELDVHFTNPRVYDEVNELSRLIRAVDPYHVTTTTISTLDRETIELVRERSPDLDFMSIQAYGALALMPQVIEYLGAAPFMVTEWGPLGYWEVGKTRWGAPVEPTSTEKARHYLRQYRDLLLPYSAPSLGSYAFLWGWKQERTHTWFSLFTTSGESTGAVDALELAWAGKIPSNLSPVLESLTLARRQAADSVRLRAGKRYLAKVVANDPEGEQLSYMWSVKPESDATVVGGDREGIIEDLSGVFDGAVDNAEIALIAPNAGAYRLFVEVHDRQGHAAHANIPFLVRGKVR